MNKKLRSIINKSMRRALAEQRLADAHNHERWRQMVAAGMEGRLTCEYGVNGYGYPVLVCKYTIPT